MRAIEAFRISEKANKDIISGELEHIYSCVRTVAEEGGYTTYIAPCTSSIMQNTYDEICRILHEDGYDTTYRIDDDVLEVSWARAEGKEILTSATPDCKLPKAPFESNWVKVYREDFEELVDRALSYNALDAAGVDNWEYYGDAFEDYFASTECPSWTKFVKKVVEDYIIEEG